MIATIKDDNINTGSLFSIEDVIKGRHKSYVIADETAADVWGFSSFVDSKIHFIVPKQYNPNIKNENIVFKQMIKNKIEQETTTIQYNNKDYKILTKEVTIIKIIKKLKNNYNDQYLDLIASFFKTDYDHEALEYFSKKYNVFEVINAFEAVYGRK